MTKETSTYNNVFFEEKKVCNRGRARYQLDLAPVKKFPVTEDFAAAVCSLPDSYSEGTYYNFIERWGTVRCMLVHAFITSRLDYCKSLLYGVSEYQIRKLQRVMNASVQLVYCARKYREITHLLQELHWLPVRMHIDFKILLITFKILQGFSSSYLKNLVSILPASHYQLRRNNDGILLASLQFKTKKTNEIARLW